MKNSKKDCEHNPCGNNSAKDYAIPGDVFGWDHNGIMGWITPDLLSVNETLYQERAQIALALSLKGV